MALFRRLDTAENRAFWEFVDKVSADVRSWPEFQRGGWAEHHLCGETCRHGNGKQACADVRASSTGAGE